ncbi:Serine transporter [Klebsiella pneumoniae]|nr:Serine transporter [Klebsiella pneumoniae]
MRRSSAHDGGGAVFVLSCVLSLSPQQLAEAKAQNLSILSYLANQYDTPIIASPIIAFVAITSFLTTSAPMNRCATWILGPPRR